MLSTSSKRTPVRSKYRSLHTRETRLTLLPWTDGNGTAVFTNSGATARRFEREVEAGQIGINVPIPVPIPPFAWSGSHASILGGHSLYGQGGLDFWTSHKVRSHSFSRNIVWLIILSLLQTVTSLWRAADAVTATADVSMPTHK